MGDVQQEQDRGHMAVPRAGQGQGDQPRAQSHSVGKAPDQEEHLSPSAPPVCIPEWCLSLSAPPVSHLFLPCHLLWLTWSEGETRGGTALGKGR